MAAGESNGFGMNRMESELITIIFLFVLPIIIEFIHPGFWASIWMKVKIAEINVALWFSNFYSPEYTNKLEVYLDKLHRIAPRNVTVKAMMKVDRDLEFSVTWIYGFLMCLYGWKIFNREDHRRKHDLESLIREQTKVWRFNRHLLKMNPLKEGLNIKVGKYAIRSRVHTYIFDKKLVEHKETENFIEYYKLLKDETKAVFEKQYGNPFSGLQHMTVHEKRVAAVFLLFAHERETEAWDLLGDISYSYNDENPIFIKKKAYINPYLDSKNNFLKYIVYSFTAPFVNKWVTLKYLTNKYFLSAIHLFNKNAYFDYCDIKVNHVLETYANASLVKEAIKGHYYTYGVLRHILVGAKKFGVLAIGRFTWLKAEDRTLWFVLLEVGMEETGVECAYPRSHYEVESAVGRRLTIPQGDRYIPVLEEYLHSKNALGKHAKEAAEAEA